MKVLALWVFFLAFAWLGDAHTEAAWRGLRSLVRREERSSVTATAYGEISSAEVVGDGGAQYHLQFITLEPNALFLPVLLHSDMVLYVHTGSGRLSWAFDGDDEELRRVELRRGDIYRLPPGVIFYVQSDLELESAKLRIHAIFANAEEGFYEPSIGAYSSISDLLRGFNSRLLQEAFMAPVEVVEDITSAERPPPIVHGVPKQKKGKRGREARLIEAYMRQRAYAVAAAEVNNKKRKPFNLYKADRDFENCNGWSVALTSKEVHLLDHSNIGVFMVNLTMGSMMAPHWNPTATEIAIVLQGSGMIRVACPTDAAKESQCKDQSFRVSPGDVFAVPRFHPMAQMSFNNDSLVFVGFTASKKRNYPQFLVGRSSVLRVIRGDILAASFNVGEEAVERLLSRQADSVILDCTSCAEEEEEKEREEEEEAAREEEEERQRREEEEEERKREEEEAAARRREEEEEREREREKEREEERRRRERAAEREQEEAARQEEEILSRAEEEEEEWSRRHGGGFERGIFKVSA